MEYQMYIARSISMRIYATHTLTIVRQQTYTIASDITLNAVHLKSNFLSDYNQNAI